MIETGLETTLSIHIVNSSASPNNDVKTFISILETCKKEINKPGFGKMFNDAQTKLLNDLHDKLVP